FDAVDSDLPVDTGGRASILDVDGAAEVMLDEVAHLAGRCDDIFVVSALDTRVDRLAGGRAVLLRHDLDVETGDALHALADVLEDASGRIALAPRHELEVEGADRVGRRVARREAVAAAERHDDVLDALDLQQLVLDFDQHVADLVRRIVAACDHSDGAEL